MFRNFISDILFIIDLTSAMRRRFSKLNYLRFYKFCSNSTSLHAPKRHNFVLSINYKNKSLKGVVLEVSLKLSRSVHLTYLLLSCTQFYSHWYQCFC